MVFDFFVLCHSEYLVDCYSFVDYLLAVFSFIRLCNSYFALVKIKVFYDSDGNE